MRRVLRLAPLLAVCLAADCKHVPTLQGAADSLIADIDDLFGGKSNAVKYLAAIRGANEKRETVLRKDVDDAFEITRTAVRGLGNCDYPTWAEAGLVIEVMSSMADEHESSLVRAECLDTLTHMAPWTLKAASAPEHPSTDAEKSDAFRTLRDVAGKTDADPATTAAATAAVSTMADYPFAHVSPPTSVGSDNRAAARAYHASLREARVALASMTGRVLLGFEGDPGMRDALERAYPNLSAAVLRLTLIKAALDDASESTRCAAVRDLGAVAPEEGGAVLRRALLYDGWSSVRREAAKAIAAYPPNVAVPALIDGLGDEMADVRGASASSLEAVTGQTFGDDRGAWLRWWQSNATKAAAAGTGE